MAAHQGAAVDIVVVPLAQVNESVANLLDVASRTRGTHTCETEGKVGYQSTQAFSDGPYPCSSAEDDVVSDLANFGNEVA